MSILKKDALIAAPMVRASTLPFRLTSLFYGADVVYSAEIIDRSLLCCKRIYDGETESFIHSIDSHGTEKTKTVNFVIPQSNNIVFQTCDAERNRIVLQLGTNDGDRALRAAKMVEADVAGIDINMGCPKRFSTHAGMGSALMNTPDLAVKILTTLTNGLSIPVSCKIRIFEKEDKTLEFVKRIVKTGISRLTIHGRTASDRYGVECNEEIIYSIANSYPINIAINGLSNFVLCSETLSQYKSVHSDIGIMLARAAMSNPTVFDYKKLHHQEAKECIKHFLRYTVMLDLCIGDVLYNLRKFSAKFKETELSEKIETESSLFQLCELYNVQLNDYQPLHSRISQLTAPHKILESHQDDDEDNGVVHLIVEFDRTWMNKSFNPKVVLWEFAQTKKMEKPEYETVEKSKLERVFKSRLNFAKMIFSTTNWSAEIETSSRTMFSDYLYGNSWYRLQIQTAQVSITKMAQK